MLVYFFSFGPAAGVLNLSAEIRFPRGRRPRTGFAVRVSSVGERAAETTVRKKVYVTRALHMYIAAYRRQRGFSLNNKQSGHMECKERTATNDLMIGN